VQDFLKYNDSYIKAVMKGYCKFIDVTVDCITAYPIKTEKRIYILYKMVECRAKLTFVT
jgi:hypothetical protein